MTVNINLTTRQNITFCKSTCKPSIQKNMHQSTLKGKRVAFSPLRRAVQKWLLFLAVGTTTMSSCTKNSSMRLENNDNRNAKEIFMDNMDNLTIGPAKKGLVLDSLAFKAEGVDTTTWKVRKFTNDTIIIDESNICRGNPYINGPFNKARLIISKQGIGGLLLNRVAANGGIDTRRYRWNNERLIERIWGEDVKTIQVDTSSKLTLTNLFSGAKRNAKVIHKSFK